MQEDSNCHEAHGAEKVCPDVHGFIVKIAKAGKRVPVAIAGLAVATLDIGIVLTPVRQFQCRPIDYFWSRWDGEHQGTCVNFNAIGWANAIVGITLDLWMLAIPLNKLRGLKLSWKKKLGVTLMFCVGTL